MKTAIILSTLLMVGGGAAFWLAGALAAYIMAPRQQAPNKASPPAANHSGRIIRAIGYIEPVSEVRKLTFKVDGAIEKCRVEIGRRVEAGDVLATLRNQDERAAVLVAEQQLAVAQAERDKLLSGVHPKQIDAAQRRIAKFEEKARHAKQHFDRQKKLRESNDISATDFDWADTDLRQVLEELKEAQADLTELATHVRAEDKLLAESKVQLANANVMAAKERLQNTILAAPICGTVLEILKREGESVRLFDPQPTMVFADLSNLRVRAEIDERYVALVHVGQEATGQFAWLPREDRAIISCIKDSLTWFRESGVKLVYAPWHAPMQLLGAGIPASATLPESRPFLESTNDPQLAKLLVEIGFSRAWSNPYFKIDLAGYSDASKNHTVPGISCRDLDREHLQHEVATLIPLINETISTLPHCTVISERLFYGAASEMRDLIVPGFWRLAFQGDELVGFIAAFPNVTEAFSQACGMADVADLVKVSDALDDIGEGFIAWMGISPSFPNSEQLAADLLQQVLTTMRRRGFKDTWISWELHNGQRQLAERDFAEHRITSRLNDDVYQLPL